MMAVGIIVLQSLKDLVDASGFPKKKCCASVHNISFLGNQRREISSWEEEEEEEVCEVSHNPAWSIAERRGPGPLSLSERKLRRPLCTIMRGFMMCSILE